MKITTANETYTVTPTKHKSVSIGPSLFVRKMFKHLDLFSLFTPLKKRGVDICTLVEANIAYKTTENLTKTHFRIYCILYHKRMQPTRPAGSQDARWPGQGI